MRLHRIALVVAVGVVGSALYAPAAHAETASVTLTGGTLTIATQPFAFSNTPLTGAGQSINASPGSAWSVTDGRGTGAAWTATISSTALTSAAGSVETSPQTIAVGQMSTVDGTVTAGTGADATTNITTTGVTLSGSGQTFLASSGTNRGSYTFTPTMTLAIPANAYRSNYAGTVGSSALNPYTATLTVSIS